MSRASAENHYAHPELGLALRWLREIKAGKTRKSVSERARISVHYLRKIENGERSQVSRVKLDLILAALGADMIQLQAILESRPYAEHEFRPQKDQQVVPEDYRAAAERAFTDLRADETWSNEVADPTAAVRIYGEIIELGEKYLRLTAPERAELLARVREL